jgi:hypothetical protein
MMLSHLLPPHSSWLAQLPSALKATLEHQGDLAATATGPVISTQACAFLWSLLERFVDPLLVHIRKSCQEAQPSVDTNLIATLTQLLQHHLALGLAAGTLKLAGPGSRASRGDEEGGEEDAALAEVVAVALQYLFAFCCVWGLGGNLQGGSRDSFDSCFRALFNGVANFPEGSGECAKQQGKLADCESGEGRCWQRSSCSSLAQ